MPISPLRCRHDHHGRACRSGAGSLAFAASSRSRLPPLVFCPLPLKDCRQFYAFLCPASSSISIPMHRRNHPRQLVAANRIRGIFSLWFTSIPEPSVRCRFHCEVVGRVPSRGEESQRAGAERAISRTGANASCQQIFICWRPHSVKPARKSPQASELATWHRTPEDISSTLRRTSLAHPIASASWGSRE